MCLEVKRTASVRNFHTVREKQKKYKQIRMKRKKMSETEINVARCYQWVNPGKGRMYIAVFQLLDGFRSGNIWLPIHSTWVSSRKAQAPGA